jgi:tRNA-splicing ligase RtcB
MNTAQLERVHEFEWRRKPVGAMRVPVVIFATESLIREMDDKVLEQAGNVATLPGIVEASYVMPDGHWGYGFPIGGVAAFDPDGVVSAGGVGFDIRAACVASPPASRSIAFARRKRGLRTSRSNASRLGRQPRRHPPDDEGMEAMLKGGASWAVGAVGTAGRLVGSRGRGAEGRPSPTRLRSAPRSGRRRWGRWAPLPRCSGSRTSRRCGVGVRARGR